MFLAISKQNAIIGIIIASIVLLVVLLIVILLVTKKKRKPKKVETKKVSIEYLDNIIMLLGSKENIKETSISGKRLSINLNDLSKANLDELNLKFKGLFIAGNTIKMSIDFDLEQAQDYFKNL